VYKNGQAGITKATVTIVFDNTNAAQCPQGYEKCREISVARQVVVGGKNKFLINGKLVQNKKVQDFFCSIQLNVNNPNFLIMQGKIQQVLNMKPKEVCYHECVSPTIILKIIKQICRFCPWWRRQLELASTKPSEMPLKP